MKELLHRYRLHIIIFLFILFLPELSYSANEITLKFDSPLSVEISYPIEVTSSVIYSTDKNTSGQINAPEGKLSIPRGISAITISFDNSENIVGADFSYKYSALNYSLISEITIGNLPNLSTLNLENNHLTAPVAGTLPDNCSVSYGTQESITIEVSDDNKVNLGQFQSPEWTVTFRDTYSGLDLPTSAYTKYDYGIYRINSNYITPIKINLSHSSGLKLTNNGGLIFNKIVYPFITIVTNGTGSSSTLTIGATMQTITQSMIIAVNEARYESNSWMMTIPFSSVLYQNQKVTLQSNIIDNLNYFDLSDLGITELQFASSTEIKNINLSGNSLLLSQIPVEKFSSNTNVTLGAQKPFILTPVGNTYTFDLSKEIKAGANITWLDSNNNPISEDYYIYDNGTYRFTKKLENIHAHITSSHFSDYTIDSAPINIDLNLTPFISFSRKQRSDLLYTFGIKVSRDIMVSIDNNQYNVSSNNPVRIRLTSDNYEHTIYTSDNSAIIDIDLSGLGIYHIDIKEIPANISSMDLSNNALTFSTFPQLDVENLVLDNQEPVILSINPDNGIIEFPEYKECNTIRLLDSDGAPISSDVYETSSFNDYMVLKKSVSNAVIHFSEHSGFPGVDIYSTKFTFNAPSSLEKIFGDNPFTIKNSVITVTEGVEFTILDVNGIYIGKATSANPIALRHGVYIIIDSHSRKGYKIFI